VARQPDTPPPPPPVQRLWIRYAKRGRLRFTSHRDFARAFERALRRADIPMAYSAGFTPHPKISYVGASPTGVASEAEYLEIALAAHRDPDDVRRALDAALPPGLDVLEVVPATAKGLADRIDGSWWQIELPGADAGQVRAAVDRFLALDAAPVERTTKDGRRTVDARAVVVAMTVTDAPRVAETADRTACAIIDLVVRHATPAVRPDDVITALRQAAALPTPVPPLVTRLAQGLLGDAGSAAGVRKDRAGRPAPCPLTDPLAPGVAVAAP
jgi:radical SAM-linked protein